MWGESSKKCEINCQCSGLITDKFRINSGNNGTKRKQEDSMTHNYKIKMTPHSIDFSKSPNSPVYTPGKRQVLGEIQISNSPLERLKSPHHNPLKSPIIVQNINSPLLTRTSPVLHTLSPILNKNSPLTSRSKRSRITRVMEERTKFKKCNKENEEPLISETFIKLDVEEETRDFLFANKFQPTQEKVTDWSETKLDFTHSLPAPKEDILVPEKEVTQDIEDFETLHDLEEELAADNFDECSKYEIISTDSPDIISRGRATSSRKVISKNFDFGAPLAENEPSTSFNKPHVNATRMLVFEEENFELPSPIIKKQAVKKSLKFTETPTKLRHEKSDSSIGSMNSSSLSSPKLSIFTSESTTSMESGFISEFEEPFLEIEESSSPKVANFNELLSGQIKTNVVTDKTFLRRPLFRSLSSNPQCKAKMSLFPILENPEQRSYKRMERSETEVANKRRKCNFMSHDVGKLSVVKRPPLQRALSENNALIMSAMARSAADPDLIGDFSVPFSLPLTTGDHSDLKSISCETLAGLLNGDYKDTISNFQVIDCRYPYEFDGGHIINAVNYYTQAHVLQLIQSPLYVSTDIDKRSILIFHCEFSIERGPKLSRFLRSSDRQHNADRYPNLHYPEIYLLHSGYSAFYVKFPELCTPSGYVAMMDPKHKTSLKHHRSQ